MALEDATQAQPSPLDTDEIPIVVLAQRQRPTWLHTWALGGIALALAAFMAASGLLLLFHYRPVVATAYTDLSDLSEVSRFGFVRVLHRWAGHALLIVAALHLLRTVLAGDYHHPVRRASYHVSLALALVVLFSALTGYLLPWDRHAEWLIGFLAERDMPVGDMPLGDTLLTRIHALHCGILPVIGVLLLLFHLRRAAR